MAFEDRTLVEALTIVISINFLALVSPGPDFALVVRNSLSRSRVDGVWTAFGIAASNFTHLIIVFFGIGTIIASSSTAPKIIQCFGALYLIWLGTKGLLAKKGPAEDSLIAAAQKRKPGENFKMFRQGFLTSFSNVKAMMFFVGLVSSIGHWAADLRFITIYSSVVITMAFIWFSTVAYIFGAKKLRQKIFKNRHLIDRVTGAALFCFGVLLIHNLLQ